MLRSNIARRLVVMAVFVFCGDVMAGGGPRNVLVLYNDTVVEAYTTAEYYADARAIPREQLCALSGIDAGQLEISFDDYQSLILPRLNSCLQRLSEPGRIGYLVIVRGLPYRVQISGGFTTSLSAMLQVYETTQISDGTPLAGQSQFKTESGVYSPTVENPLYQKHIGG
ncbi:MAG TPA: hypothetical protein EYN06_07835, partial [Myxococcales bacterium]|nr:hypothetical protein [Myxococcales bacterium]